MERHETEMIVDAVNHAVDNGGSKEDLIKDIFDALGLADEVTDALEEVVNDAEYEQGELREQINELKEAEGIDVDEYETGNAEIDELEEKWDAYDEQIHEANNLIDQF